jgi:hypothetical protein
LWRLEESGFNPRTLSIVENTANVFAQCRGKFGAVWVTCLHLRVVGDFTYPARDPHKSGREANQDTNHPGDKQWHKQVYAAREEPLPHEYNHEQTTEKTQAVR